MSRYRSVSEDEERLPEGMQRVGYDADTQIYTFLDTDGSYWESEPGVEYGTMHRRGSPRPRQAATPPGYWNRQRHEFWRYMGPWLILVLVVLAILVRYLRSRTAPLECGDGLERYVVAEADSCWKIAHNNNNLTVDGLKELNPNLDCDKLWPGMELCLPKTTG